LFCNHGNYNAGPDDDFGGQHSKLRNKNEKALRLFSCASWLDCTCDSKGKTMNYINHHPVLVYGITAALFFVLGFISAKIHNWLSKEIYG
jgi:hypothetical protein